MNVEFVANNAQVYTVHDGNEIILVAIWEDEDDEDKVLVLSSCDCSLEDECPHVTAVMQKKEGRL
jgi:hypothetical protein